MSIVKEGSRLVLENEFMRRVLDLTDGICTKTYHIRPGGQKLGDTHGIPCSALNRKRPLKRPL